VHARQPLADGVESLGVVKGQGDGDLYVRERVDDAHGATSIPRIWWSPEHRGRGSERRVVPGTVAPVRRDTVDGVTPA
jgi:hypothetical protein